MDLHALCQGSLRWISVRAAGAPYGFHWISMPGARGPYEYACLHAGMLLGSPMDVCNQVIERGPGILDGALGIPWDP